MKMRFFVIVLQVLILQSAWCAKAKLTIHVTDDFGNPIVRAPVELRTFEKGYGVDPKRGDEYRHVKGETDAKGYVTLSIRSKYGDIVYYVSDERVGKYIPVEYSGPVGPVIYDASHYYDGGSGSVDFEEHKNGKWLPWNSTVEIVIKPRVNPVRMYHKSPTSSLTFSKSEYGKEMGFDLIEYDWIAPYGKGKVSDFIFKFDYVEIGMDELYGPDYDSMFTLTFSNEGDGIQHLSVPKRAGSTLRLPRMAPESGYESIWKIRKCNIPGERVSGMNDSDNYIFRVRTKKNEHGEIISALYGKIEGPFILGVGKKGFKFRFCYYLNPTPNDLSLECGGNLFESRR